MATYATPADLVAYSPGYDNADAPATEVLLTQAERDIDLALGNVPRNPSVDSPKLNPAFLSPHEQASLRRATCAQAEYRLVKGEEFFILYRPEKQSGPDGSVDGKEPLLAPKARLELPPRLTRPWGRRQRHWLPNQNVGDDVL